MREGERQCRAECRIRMCNRSRSKLWREDSDCVALVISAFNFALQ